MGLLRLVPLILFFVFYKLAGTERARYRLWAKQPFMFGTQVANHTIILLLGLAFCCLAPVIAPFALLYFTLALVGALSTNRLVTSQLDNVAARACFGADVPVSRLHPLPSIPLA